MCARSPGARAVLCPIKHARRVIGSHARYALFDDYGDGEGYQERLTQRRKALAKDE